MSFGNFTYRLFYLPDKCYRTWPGGRLNRRDVLVEDLKPMLKVVNNLEYGYNDGTGSFAPLEVHCISPGGKVRRTYLIHELLD